MNAIVPFNFGDAPIRVEDRAGALWFVLGDVCRVLEIANPADAAGRLDDDERDIVIADTPGGRQEVTAINESGLYKLVLRSRKPSAKRFSKWVTAEVLPTIRRSGGYGMPTLPQLDDVTLRALLLGKMDQVDGLKAENDQLATKAHTLDRLTNADGAVPPTQAAKLIGAKPGRLFDWLEEHGWTYHGADGLVARQPRIDAGLMIHRAHRIDRPYKPPKFVNRVLITPKGIAKLLELGAGRG